MIAPERHTPAAKPARSSAERQGAPAAATPLVQAHSEAKTAPWSLPEVRSEPKTVKTAPPGPAEGRSGAKMAGRDAGGRFTTAFHRSAAPMRSPVEQALTAAGSSTGEALEILMRQTLEKAKAGDKDALARLDRLLLPKDRLIPAAKGSTAAKRAAGVVRALAAGELTPREAEAAMRVVNVHAEAGEWEQLAATVERSSKGRRGPPQSGPEGDDP